MKKIHKLNLMIAVILLSLIFFALYLRHITASEVTFSFASRLRSYIYIGIISAWYISLKMRIVEKRIQRHLCAVALLMIFWMVVRTIKFGSTNNTIQRYLWYFYYLPMLFIPLEAFIISMSLGNKKQPGWIKYLFVLANILLLLVLTNDIHQRVFIFKDSLLSTKDYTYGIGYYIVALWMITFAGISLFIMVSKCRLKDSWIYLPLFPFVISILYAIGYAKEVPFVRVWLSDLTVAQCLFFMSMFESCIQSGLIQSNVGYRELFEATTMKAELFNKDFKLLYSSIDNPVTDTNILKKALKEATLLDENTLIKGHDIKHGYIFWQEDISKLVSINKELELTQAELIDTGDVLKVSHEQQERYLRLTEESRLYDLIELDTSEQVKILNEKVQKLKEVEDINEARFLLGEIIVLGTYIKRKSNLIFIGREKKVIDIDELKLCLNETSSNLCLCGIDAKMIVDIKKEYPIGIIHRIYDYLEDILEISFSTLKSILFCVYEEKGVIQVNATVDTNSNFTKLKKIYSSIEIEKDEDELWYLALKIKEGDYHEPESI
ncbi:MAG: histidine kinase N-terminal 7TM domain-containing protein [Bulleidia sp.]|nr:hypothetical protein [Erysipelotrichaceae bacterium]MDY2781338.1 histidine kinase N-terminal 7TM domain-containing protein [Bulleidia sp.]